MTLVLTHVVVGGRRNNTYNWRGREEEGGGEGRRGGKEGREGGEGRRRGKEEREGGEGRRRGKEEREGGEGENLIWEML